MKIFTLEEAAQRLLSGDPVVFPTETVYGLAARISDEAAIEKIYQIKGRPADNPLIVHIANLQQFKDLTRDVAPEVFLWIQKFWPGPLSLVCAKSKRVSKKVTAGLETVALRMPAHPMAQKLIELAGEPLAAPSANRSGRPSATCYADACAELSDRVEIILDGGSADCGLESTVVDVSKKPFRILRPGTISLEELRKEGVDVLPHQHLSGADVALSPGMKHRHYVPKCEVVLCAAQDLELELLQKSARKCGAIVLTRALQNPPSFYRFYNANLPNFAHDLYSNFFAAEQAGVEILLVETVSQQGLGKAVMDRLNRASSKI